MSLDVSPVKKSDSDLILIQTAENQSEIIEAFSSTSRYLDDLLNIDNTYFDGLISRIYRPPPAPPPHTLPPPPLPPPPPPPPRTERQLNKANSSDTEAAFLDLHLSIVDRFVSCKIYDKRDDFDFEIVNFPFLDGDVPRAASYCV